jgi:hypothetical protein
VVFARYQLLLRLRDASSSGSEAASVQTASLACLAEALATRAANPGLRQHLVQQQQLQQQQQQQEEEEQQGQGHIAPQLLPLVRQLLAAAADGQAVVRIRAAPLLWRTASAAAACLR